jgi:hypothetical protein
MLRQLRNLIRTSILQDGVELNRDGAIRVVELLRCEVRFVALLAAFVWRYAQRFRWISHQKIVLHSEPQCTRNLESTSRILSRDSCDSGWFVLLVVSFEKYVWRVSAVRSRRQHFPNAGTR